MATIIRNKSEVDMVLKKMAHKMLSNTQKIVYDVIQKSIKTYYQEYSPTTYHRKYKFLNSLVKTKIVPTRNGYACEVKISEDYLNYNYPDTGAFNPSYPHDYDGRFATGDDVAHWANREFPWDDEPGGNHGYTIDEGRDDGFWDASMKELDDIIEIMKDELIKNGIAITR